MAPANAHKYIKIGLYIQRKATCFGQALYIPEDCHMAGRNMYIQSHSIHASIINTYITSPEISGIL
jgi:hypothetical protein